MKEDEGSRYVQRVVGKLGLYGASQLRTDNVMVESCVNDSPLPMEEHTVFWFAKPESNCKI